MASKRKSTTPCMIPLKTLTLEGGTDSTAKDQAPDQLVTDLMNCNDLLSNGHQNVNGDSFFCKYCNFGSQETNKFVEHMNTKHLDFREDPSYVCITCSFLVKDPKELEAHNAECHAGDAGLTWSVAKHVRYTVVEQSVGDQNHDQEMTEQRTNQCVNEYSETTITKAPIMKIMKNKAETKKIVTIKDNLNLAPDKVEKKSHAASRNGSATATKASTNLVNSSSIVNGSILGTVLPTGVTQFVSINTSQPVIQPKIPTIIAPVLAKPSAMQKNQHSVQSSQLPSSKSLPKVMIPLSSIPTYNISMDSNCFLKNSFTKFPYPTKAELCYLTVVTKYPEEQIKIWFTAQRLKQGISWSPEEIEDSRKKMFNTVIQSIPQPMHQPTITVLNAPLVTNASNVQHLLQAALPGQIVSQPQGASGLLVTQPIITNGIQRTPVSLTVTSLPTSLTTTQARVASPASKAVSASQPATATSPSTSMASESFFDSNLSRSKKSRQQLSALKNSFCRNQFPTQTEVTRLTRLTGLTTRDVRKWFSDKRYHWRNKAATGENSDRMVDSPSDAMFSMIKEPDMDYALPLTGHTPSHTSRRQSQWNQTPDFTPTKYKERAPEQLRALESSFFLNNFPSDEEVNRLRSETKMTRREIDSWFSEKRKKLAEENKKVKEEEEEELEEEEEEEIEEVEGENSTDLSASVCQKTSAAENSSPVSNERKVNPIKINLKDLRVTESSDNMENPNIDESSMSTDGSSRSSTPVKNKHAKKTANQRDLLKQTFVRTQWPTNKEYDELAEETRLPRADLVRWFGDSRYSLKNGQLRWYERYKGGVDTQTVSCHPLMEYFEQHRRLCDDDIKDLCDKTEMTKEEVIAWFADRREESKDADVAIADPPSDCLDKSVTQEETCDRVLEAHESSEHLESGIDEICSNSTQTVQHLV
ncbi:zinc fingers and homeoboxes protein 3 [Pelobates fuscus]|uniref:zinc fingers and homeoboxes protein 3 n=1 Tax=Pelobates fuscus TaxID=191477 RepID=UPI002FE4970E